MVFFTYFDRDDFDKNKQALLEFIAPGHDLILAKVTTYPGSNIYLSGAFVQSSMSLYHSHAIASFSPAMSLLQKKRIERHSSDTVNHSKYYDIACTVDCHHIVYYLLLSDGSQRITVLP